MIAAASSDVATYNDGVLFAPGTVIANRYRVLRELGQGGMGAVYLVEHLHTGARHALKALHAHLGHRTSAVERFRREARVTAQIQSEHVAQVTDADVASTEGGVPFLVMELLNGRDVEQLVRERGRLAPAEVVMILAQTSRALARAHAAGIIHRDLKPENLFYHHPPTGPPVIKVLDFGVSKALDSSSSSAGGLTAGGVVGTPLYMAPEQAIGGSVTPQADIFALGMIAFRLLAGEPYWTGRTTAEVMAALLAPLPTAPSHRVPGLPPGFDHWFARSCHLDPVGRFANVDEQAMGLATALGMPASAIGATLTPLSHTPQIVGAPSPRGPSPYEPTTASPQVTPSPIQYTPSPREDTAAPVRWLLAAVGLALVMVVSAAIAAFSVGALSASAPEGQDPQPETPDKRQGRGEPGPIPTGEPYVTSGRLLGGAFLKKSNIRSVVESHRGDLLGCYRAALDEDPRLAGDVTLMITVDDLGQVSTAMASASSLPDRSLRSCCEALASDWVFLPPEGSTVSNFQYTLEFGRR